jgi:hypothetical protein
MKTVTKNGWEVSSLLVAIQLGAQTEDKRVSKASLRSWFKRFNGDAELWDAEIGDS